MERNDGVVTQGRGKVDSGLRSPNLREGRLGGAQTKHQASTDLNSEGQ